MDVEEPSVDEEEAAVPRMKKGIAVKAGVKKKTIKAPPVPKQSHAGSKARITLPTKDGRSDDPKT